ncbi:hypothetical protein G6F56_012728 [Rhizopus delemar]|nr:hypothetical protein G6F56_012728 [Rhizopus delemar]
MASLATMISEMAQRRKMTSSAALLSYSRLYLFFNGFVVDSCIVVSITAVFFLCFKEPLMERYFVFYNAKLFANLSF